MNHASRAVASLALLCLGATALVARPGRASADPTIDVPPARRGVLLRDRDRAPRLAVISEVDLAVILASQEASVYPEIGDIDPSSLVLAAARVGLLGAHGSVHYALRVDVSEALRESAGEPRMVTIDRFIDDAAVWWRPRVWAGFAFGRHKVPFSRFRQLERTSLTTGAVPFVVDRVAPDRRWGATAFGDLGALSYAAGAYADLDALEPRRRADPATDPLRAGDPSANGRFLATGYLWWTPRAPLGPDHLPSPPSDPWFRTLRPAAGLGVLWREREGADRLDISLAVQVGYRRFAGIAEVLAYSDDGSLGLGAAANASLLVSDGAVLFAFGDIDGQSSTWSVGGGAAFFVTRDRKNKLGLVGWMRRDTLNGPSRDGVLVHVQAAL